MLASCLESQVPENTLVSGRKRAAGVRSQPWVSSHWGQFGRKQTKPLQAAELGSATVGGCGRFPRTQRHP